MILRPYQDTIVDAIRAALQDGFTAPCIELCTGGGKTVIFAYIADQAARLGTRVCILVHRRELIKQTCKTLAKFGISHGVIAAGFPQTTHPIQVASVQTLHRRQGYRFDLVITDECHHGVARTYTDVIAILESTVNLGFTATPSRLTGAGLGSIYDTLISGPKVNELIALGALSPAKLFRPSNIDVQGIRSERGDYRASAIEELVSRREIVGCAVDQYIAHCNGYPAIVFCPSVAHAEFMATEFQSAGFRAMAVDGKMDNDTRDRAILGLGDGTFNVLCSCDLISEGVDVPVVTAAILLRRTKSIVIYLQQVGRALRPYEGKSHAIILDHVGNFLEHGHPTQDRSWSLDVGHVKPARDNGPAIRQCPRCYFVHEWAQACPECHFEYPKRERAEAQQVHGGLEEISPEDAAALWAAARKSHKLQDYQKAAKASGKSPQAAYMAWKRAGSRRKLARVRV